MQGKIDAVGINIGSCRARCACMDGAGGKKIPAMVPNRWGNTASPSLEGWESKEGAAESLLRSLREDAEVFLGRFVSSCVLAVPENFSPARRKSIAEAAELSGINSVRFLDEPSAAALAFGGEGRFLILDFGAAASKISVVEAVKAAKNEGGAVKILESAELAIGGRDFDLALAEWLRERLNLRAFGEPEENGVLLSEAEAVKTALSSGAAYSWRHPSFGGKEIQIEREELERMIRFPIKRVLNAAGRLWAKHRPERFLLTGGSSHIPLLREIAEREIAVPERLPFEPEDAAAAGAAIFASSGRRGGRFGKPEGDHTRDLKMRLMRMEPSLTAEQQTRLRAMLDKLESLQGVAPPLLGNIVAELEKELF